MEQGMRKDYYERLKHYIVDYRNYEGFKVLTREYGLTVEESATFMRSLIPLSKPLDIQYDIHSNKHLTLEEWINSKLKRPSWFKGLVSWFKRLVLLVGGKG